VFNLKEDGADKGPMGMEEVILEDGKAKVIKNRQDKISRVKAIKS